MNKKQTFLIFGILTICLLLALIFKVSREKKVAPIVYTPVVHSPVEPVINNPVSSSTDKYKVEVPKDIVIPMMHDQTLTVEQKKEIAVPTLVTPAAPGSQSSFRNFEIKAEGGKFMPSKIIGKVGDTMVVNFTAIDQTYSINFPSYSMRQLVNKGETKVLGFHAGESGSFKYFCDVCGENTTASGTLIIAP